MDNQLTVSQKTLKMTDCILAAVEKMARRHQQLLKLELCSCHALNGTFLCKWSVKWSVEKMSQRYFLIESRKLNRLYASSKEISRAHRRLMSYRLWRLL